MALTIDTTQKCGLTLVGHDQNGADFTFTPDSPSVFTSSNEAVATVGGSPEFVTAVGVGDATITATTVVGGKTFTSTLDVVVVAAPAVLTSITIVAGTPEPK